LEREECEGRTSRRVGEVDGLVEEVDLEKEVVGSEEAEGMSGD